MDYQVKKSFIIFELPLADYLGKRRYREYNQETKQPEEWREVWINSLQEYEERIFDSFESFAPYIEKDSFQYIDLDQAREYLTSRGYTLAEIEFFNDDFETDILRALADAKDNSHQSEWFEKFRRMTQEQIEEDLTDALSGYNYELIDRIDDKDYFKTRAEADHLRLKIDKKEVKRWLKENYPADKFENEPDYPAYFSDYALDYGRKPINTEYIDYYGTMGNYNDWLDYFKDGNDIEGTIDRYRKEETAKIDNLELAALNLRPKIEKISSYIDTYIKKEPARSKIIRQIKALKSIIKNAD